LFLPVLSILSIIALYLSYNDILKEYISKLFFYNTRQFFKTIKSRTIYDVLQHNPRLSFSFSALYSNPELRKIFQSNKLKRKFLIFVVDDEIVLKDESKRIEIFDNFEFSIDFPFEYVQCSNGYIAVNDTKDNILKEWECKSYLLDYNHVYDSKFILICIFSYCLFFALPSIFKIITTLFCSKNCDIIVFDYGPKDLIIFLNFFFGIFILVPFIR
jgi:hypothetical protein